MIILGIETSCDETAVAIVEKKADGSFEVLGETLYSQAEKHSEYGGVYPTLAKREHGKNLIPLLEKALKESGFANPKSEIRNSKQIQNLKKEIQNILEREQELAAKLIKFVETHDIPTIDAIAVTKGPGLAPALWVGVNAARALAILWDKPLVAANHMEGHILTPLLKGDSISYPLLSLLISGGHTQLVVTEKAGDYTIVGETRDDAVGEAFDKTARLLDLPYPGGPEISRRATEHRRKYPTWEPQWNFPKPMLDSGDLDFSFSGLKTAVRYALESYDGDITEDLREEVSREFEDVVTHVLLEKTREAIEVFHPKTLVLGGGVVGNKHIRTSFTKRVEEHPDLTLLLPGEGRATDNAVMIALAGAYQYERGETVDPRILEARANLRL